MLTMVVGGQFGGEGKGKVCAYLAKHRRYAAVARCGGVNSSHTIVEGKKTYRLRLLPAAAAVSKPSPILFGPGTLLHTPTLFDEMRLLEVEPSRIKIDPRAGIVTEDCIKQQRSDLRYSRIGSTLTGTGYASAKRCMRSLPLARDFAELQPMLGDVSDELHRLLHRRKNNDILVEGHQGFGLSNYHGDYPYTSSRDCTSAAMLSEIGVGPSAKLNVVLVVKIFPTRNHRGQLPNEMTTAEADAVGIREFGGGSWGIGDSRRRVGVIDFDLIARAARINGANEIAVTGADYLDGNMRAAQSAFEISETVHDFLRTVTHVTSLPVTLLSTGPETDSMIELPAGRSKQDTTSDVKQAALNLGPRHLN